MKIERIGDCVLFLGDCLEVLPTLEKGSVDAVVTSPPYAMQRAQDYGGIPERNYPNWLATVVDELGRLVRDDGSILINIREHRSPAGMSDYVHRSRMAVRERGWVEVDELVWVKSDACPTAPNDLPRRGWERVLWFSRVSRPRCFALDESRIATWGSPMSRYANGNKAPKHPRRPNYFISAICDKGVRSEHPARFPLSFASWMTSLVSKMGDTTLDPFMGSGTTGVACVNTGRKFIGIEKSPEYFAIACDRISKAYADRPQLLEAV